VEFQCLEEQELKHIYNTFSCVLHISYIRRNVSNSS